MARDSQLNLDRVCNSCNLFLRIEFLNFSREKVEWLKYLHPYHLSPLSPQQQFSQKHYITHDKIKSTFSDLCRFFPWLCFNIATFTSKFLFCLHLWFSGSFKFCETQHTKKWEISLSNSHPGQSFVCILVSMEASSPATSDSTVQAPVRIAIFNVPLPIVSIIIIV